MDVVTASFGLLSHATPGVPASLRCATQDAPQSLLLSRNHGHYNAAASTAATGIPGGNHTPDFQQQQQPMTGIDDSSSSQSRHLHSAHHPAGGAAQGQDISMITSDTSSCYYSPAFTYVGNSHGATAASSASAAAADCRFMQQDGGSPATGSPATVGSLNNADSGLGHGGTSMSDNELQSRKYHHHNNHHHHQSALSPVTPSSRHLSGVSGSSMHSVSNLHHQDSSSSVAQAMDYPYRGSNGAGVTSSMIGRRSSTATAAASAAGGFYGPGGGGGLGHQQSTQHLTYLSYPTCPNPMTAGYAFNMIANGRCFYE